MDSVRFSYYLGCRERILKREYDEFVGFLKQAGYTAIEPLEFSMLEQMFDSVDDATALSSMLKREGIAVSCYSVYIDVYEDPDAAEKYLKKQIDITSALGCPYFHHTLRTLLDKSSGEVDIDVVMPAILPTLKRLAEYAVDKEITLLYEPQGLCFNGANLSKLINSLKSMGAENVGVCLDFGNPAFVDYKALNLIDELVPLIRHVHIKDYKYCDCDDAIYRSISGKCFFEVGYGFGDMQCDECVRRLVERGYGGYFSTELTPVGTTPDDAGIDAVKSVAQLFK